MGLLLESAARACAATMSFDPPEFFDTMISTNILIGKMARTELLPVARDLYVYLDQTPLSLPLQRSCRLRFYSGFRIYGRFLDGFRQTDGTPRGMKDARTHNVVEVTLLGETEAAVGAGRPASMGLDDFFMEVTTPVSQCVTVCVCARV